jgi:branched-subunit amino acid aminotransferase/4-amino-4-deoxychorismate lyase
MTCLASVQLGYSAFTTLRSDALPQWQQAHFKRLAKQAQALQLALPCSMAESTTDSKTGGEITLWQQGMQALMKQHSPAVWRLTVHYAETHEDTSAFTQLASSEVLPSFWMASPRTTTLPSWTVDEVLAETAKGLRLLSHVYSHPTPTLKHGSLIGGLLHKRRAVAAGADDCLWLSEQKIPLETTHHAVVWLTRTGQWLQAPQSQCLPSVTLHQLEAVLATQNITLHEVSQPLPELLPGLMAGWCGNSVQGWRRIDSIDGFTLPISTRPFTQEVKRIFQAWHVQSFRQADN